MADLTMRPSMFHSKELIEAGDVVILFMAGMTFHNKYGKYSHDEMIGRKYGSKMHSPPPQSGYLHLLRPTPELWTLSLPHRTQILYMTDIAYIIMRLGVRVGGKVIEAGTGSGSMTHSLSRSVGATGSVCSFEYHKPRFEKAGEEFAEHGLSNVRLQHRNVCKDGFGDVTNADAIFLDLPAPWEAIPFAPKALNPDVVTRICCFSPCLEQVLKTAAALRAEGFSDISTQEVLIRTYDLVPPPLSGSHHLMDVSTITTQLRDHEKRKEERRAVQMRNAREKVRAQRDIEAQEEEAMREAEGADSEAHGEKRKLAAEDESEAASPKKPRLDGPSDPEGTAVGAASADAKPELEEELLDEKEDGDEEDGRHEAVAPAAYDEPVVPWSSMVLTKPSPEMRGHTSYLTFATFYPASVRAKIAAQDDTTAPPTRVATPGATAPAPGGA